MVIHSFECFGAGKHLKRPRQQPLRTRIELNGLSSLRNWSPIDNYFEAFAPQRRSLKRSWSAWAYMTPNAQHRIFREVKNPRVTVEDLETSLELTNISTISVWRGRTSTWSLSESTLAVYNCENVLWNDEKMLDSSGRTIETIYGAKKGRAYQHQNI